MERLQTWTSKIRSHLFINNDFLIVLCVLTAVFSNKSCGDYFTASNTYQN